MSMRFPAVFTGLALLSGMVLAAGAPTEPAPVPELGDDVEDIIVTGQRRGVLRKLMLDFIIEIGDPVSRDRGFARWRDDVCVGVHNLVDRAAAQYVADRISLAALEVGLEPGEPGCRANLNVIFTPNARDTAVRLAESSPRSFRPWGGTGGTTQGLDALEAFKTADVPVRWWHITMIVDEMGNPAMDLSGGLLGLPQVRGSNSRIKNSVSDELWGSIVIVDTSKLGSVRWEQLTDYLAMVSLAQVKPDGAPAGYDSILNLFSDGNRPAGMTDMDRTYLRALYEMDTMMLPRIQRGVFASTMLRELREGDD
jgi:hypothetical protein